jgi:RimJ/RimL family protein N-acetyltransferase
MSESHESPVPPGRVFETERLVVRPWTLADAERHLEIYSRWEVVKWLGGDPKVLTDVDASRASIKRWQARPSGNGRFGIWAVEVADTGVVAGTVLMAPMALSGEESARLPEDGGDVEVGWHFHPDSWGHGYATEAARGAVAKGFAEGLDEIVAVVLPGNDPSMAVCRRLGMTASGLTDRWYGLSMESFRLRRAA